jgi:hypothetical protein
VPEAQLYVTPAEARELRDALEGLLADPEANEHVHLGEAAEFSLSIVTPRKLGGGGYTPWSSASSRADDLRRLAV